MAKKSSLRAILRGIEEDEAEHFSFGYPQQSLPKGHPAIPWQQKAAELQRIAPVVAVSSMNFLETAILPDGQIATTVAAADGQRYLIHAHLNIDNSQRNALMHCGCKTFALEGSCDHAAQFLETLHAELSDDETKLAERIAHGEFSTDEEFAEILDSDEADFLSNLDDIISRCARIDAYDDVEYSPIPEAPAQRLVWGFDISQDGIHAYCVQQKEKKRGGWTKGRKRALKDLHQAPEMACNSIDRQLIDLISRTRHYYYDWIYTFEDLERAFEILEGQEVLCGGETAKLVKVPFEVQVEFSDDGLTYKNSISNGEPGVILRVVDTLLFHAQEAAALRFTNCGETELRLLQIIDDPRAWRGPREEIIQRLQKFQQYVSVVLPESIAGTVEIVPPQLVALLHALPDGHLDCCLRVETSTGRLVPPGTGSAVHVVEQDGRKIQRRRDKAQELDRSVQAAHQLGLQEHTQIDAFDWRLKEFVAALALLEKLETAEENWGIRPVWNKGSEEQFRVLGAVTAKNVRVDVRRKRDWFGLQGSCRIGDTEIGLADLLAAADEMHDDSAEYIQFKSGDWAKISRELRRTLKRLRDAANQNRNSIEIGATAAPVVAELMDAEMELKASKAWNDCLARLEKSRQLTPTIPDGFAAAFRDYQLEGYHWLCRLAEWGVGGILADDMGLGKTVQALALLLRRSDIGPTLVVAPTSVGFNWQRETERFTPDLKPHLYRETDRQEFLQTVGPGDVVICSYGLVLRDADALAKVEWGTLVLDEAQFVKNSRSKTSMAIRDLPADWTLALTGTPVENHLGELWSIFRLVSPALLGSWEQFRKRFAAPIEKNNDSERRTALSQLLQPFVLRRRKQEVLTELPERTETNLYVDLSPAERKRYDQMRLAAVGEIDEIVGMSDTKDQRFRVLAMLTRLRQLACHVGLVDDAWQETSAKLELLTEKVGELRDGGHRVLIFSQFTSYLKKIRATFDEQGVSYEYLDGTTTAKQRQQRIDNFQGGSADAFLISLKAGGTGLNLTAADYVIHMDPWWNPAVEDQATDRAHRIGQTRPVMVYRIVARGTIEEEILSLHATKRDLVAGVMNGTEAAGKLTTAELIEMIRGNA